MKKTVKSLSLLLLFSCLTYLSLEADVVRLHKSQGQAEMPFILVLENGDFLVVFNEGHHFNADAELLYKRYSQSTGNWSTAEKAVKKTSSSSFAQLALDSTGKVHMVCMDGNSSPHRDIYYANYDVDKDNWSNKTLVYDSAGVNSSWPRLRIEDDIMYIVWTHNYNPSIGFTDVVMVTNEVGGDWPVPKAQRKTVSNTAPSASVHNFFQVRDKNIYCAWVDDDHKHGNWNIYYTEGMYDEGKDDWNWKKATQLFPGVNQYGPALDLDDMGDVHLIYSNKNGPVWYAQKTGSNWSSKKSISTGGASFFMILFMKYSHGLLHTVWRQTASNGEGLFYGRALPDGTWAEPVMIADGQIFPGYPVLDVDANGDVHVVWSDGYEDRPRHIYYTKVELPGEPPSAVISASVYEGLVPLTVNFNAAQSSDADGKIEEYRWNFGDGTSAMGKNVTHTFTEEGTFLVKLSVIDDDLRVGTDQVDIVVSTGKPIATISVSATMGMIPLTVLFDGSSSSDFDGEIVWYKWDFGDGTSGTGITANHTYETGGDFTATLKVTDNDGKSGTASQMIIVYQKPEASFTASPEIGIAPLEVSFDASASADVDGQVESYHWDFGDGMTGDSEETVHTYSTAGTFLVVLTAMDDDGVTDTTTTEIRVLDKPLAPQNVTVERLVNKTFLFVDYINKISWDENPGNSGLFTLSQYRIYRKAQNDSQFVFVGEVSAEEFLYEDRKFNNAQEAAGYVYAVTAVDDQGNESDYIN